mgnify:CR=1 FL=1
MHSNEIFLQLIEVVVCSIILAHKSQELELFKDDYFQLHVDEGE